MSLVLRAAEPLKAAGGRALGVRPDSEVEHTTDGGIEGCREIRTVKAEIPGVVSAGRLDLDRCQTVTDRTGLGGAVPVRCEPKEGEDLRERRGVVLRRAAGSVKVQGYGGGLPGRTQVKAQVAPEMVRGRHGSHGQIAGVGPADRPGERTPADTVKPGSQIQSPCLRFGPLPRRLDLRRSRVTLEGNADLNGVVVEQRI